MLRSWQKPSFCSGQGGLLTRLGIVIYLLVLSVVSVIAGPATSAYANQSNPSPDPTVEIDVYRNLLETGDRLFIFYANIPYSSTPTTGASQAFIWRLIALDGVTELGSTTGYDYHGNGYGYNLYTMYFSAADNISWAQAYTLRLSGNPAIFDSPPTYNFTLTASDYTTLSTASDVRTALEDKLITIVADLNNKWSLTTTFYLTEETESGMYLSIYGQDFIRGALIGAQGLAPGIFVYSAGDINGTDRTWDTQIANNNTAQAAGTWVETAKQGGAEIWGTGYDLSSIMLLFVIVALVGAGGMWVSRNPWAGVLDAGLAAIILVRMPLFDAAVISGLALIIALLWEYFAARVWGLIR